MCGRLLGLDMGISDRMWWWRIWRICTGRRMVRLDRRLNWSGKAVYDLDNPRRLASMYETVLREASSADQLATWLEGETLVRLWPDLVVLRRCDRRGKSVFFRSSWPAGALRRSATRPGCPPPSCRDRAAGG